MDKVQIMGVLSACVFALLGFLESGVIAVVGVVISCVLWALVFTKEQENKRKSFQRTKRALVRSRMRRNYIGGTL